MGYSDYLEDDCLDKIEIEKTNRTKYKKREKKIKESFKFEDLLSDEQIEKLLNYKRGM